MEDIGKILMFIESYSDVTFVVYWPVLPCSFNGKNSRISDLMLHYRRLENSFFFLFTVLSVLGSNYLHVMKLHNLITKINVTVISYSYRERMCDKITVTYASVDDYKGITSEYFL